MPTDSWTVDASAEELVAALRELEYALRHQVVSDPALPLASVEHRAIRKAYDRAAAILRGMPR